MPDAGDPELDGSVRALRRLFDAVPTALRRRAVTHVTWAATRADSYERLAFLGDGVLGVAIASHLYRTLDEQRVGAGRLTVVRAGTIAHGPCRDVATRLGLPELVLELAPDRARTKAIDLIRHERPLAEMTEAVIGACYLEHGFDRTCPAVVEAFTPELGRALEHRSDHKGRLQEWLMARGQSVEYAVVEELGEPHRRTFVVEASVEGATVGSGRGRSKKLAEQEAAREALTTLGA
ncbi:putative dsRNA-binding protein [Patulibacter brassicae]|uniref:Ribonuclease 3 n=1 Tax=Patulibacter brassicae TaxID=1705717 RepID=A0ABU4VH31_9ACTN|nr:putative dsRNA-binding protein [Patulibacter brassicae]MDX8150454.1 putative dsRNA-binding protein [Patulibacter brassicae]